MAWYYCEICERDREEFFHGCVEHPNDESECICEECAQRLEALYDFDEAEEEAKEI